MSRQVARRTVRNAIAANSFEINPKAYGYWFTSDGTMIEVPRMGHEPAARKYIDSKPGLRKTLNADLPDDTYRAIFNLGWIRVNNEKSLISFTLGKEQLSQGAFDAMSKATKDISPTYDEYFVDVMEEDGRNNYYTIPAERGPRALMGFLHRYMVASHRKRSGIMVNASLVKMEEDDMMSTTVYGGWITDDGNIYKAGYQDHLSVAVDIVESKSEYYSDYDPDNGYIYSYVFSKGWVRTHHEARSLNFEFRADKMTPPVANAIMRYIKFGVEGMEFSKIWFDIIKLNNPNDPDSRDTREHHSFDGPQFGRDAIQFLRRHIRLNRTQISANVQFDPAKYGYWITDIGDLLPVGYQDHAGVASRFVRESPLLSKEQREEAIKENPQYWVKYKLGWIRMISIGGRLNLQVLTTASPKAIQRLKELMQDNDFEDCHLEVIEPRTASSRMEFHRQSFYPVDATRVMQFINSKVSAWKRKDKQRKEPVLSAHSLPDNFKEALALAEKLERETAKAGEQLKSIAAPSGKMGLTPDAVKSSPKYKEAKAAYDEAFARMRAYNGVFVKKYKKELAAYRDEKRSRRLVTAEDTIRTFGVKVRNGITKDNYGYWVTHEGKIIPVRPYGHDTAAEQLVKDANLDLDKLEEMKIHTATQFALQMHGWIRIVARHTSLAIEISENLVAQRAYQAFAAAMENTSEEWPDIIIEWNVDSDNDTSEHAMFDWSQKKRALQFIKRNVAPQVMPISFVKAAKQRMLSYMRSNKMV